LATPAPVPVRAVGCLRRKSHSAALSGPFGRTKTVPPGSDSHRSPRVRSFGVATGFAAFDRLLWLE
jgi:hypothetical protein